MQAHESIRLAQFSLAVRESSLKRLHIVGEHQINWRPQPSAMSFADIGYHLVEADSWLFRKLEERELEPMKGSAGAAGILSSEDFQGLLSRLDECGTERAELIRSLNQKQLDELIHDARFGGKVSLWWIIVRGNLDHEIHHRGQLAVYLRIAGLV